MADTIIARLRANAAEAPERTAVVHKVDGRWIRLGWRDYAALVERAARGYLDLGLAPGQVVAILARNRLAWAVADLAAMAAGGVPTGIYPTSTAEQTAFILRHAEAPLCVVEDESQLAKLRAARGGLPALRWAVLLDGEPPAADRGWVLGWEELLRRGDGVGPALLDERIAGLEPEGLATLIYTSGTTGDPKGVMLSHSNLTWTADAVRAALPPYDELVEVSYLPLSHIAEQMLTLHLPVSLRGEIWFAESLEKLRETLLEVRPTVFFGVPRVWEKIGAALAERLGAATGVKRRLAGFARRAATAWHEAAEARRVPGPLLRLRYGLARRLVLRKVRAALGLDRAVFFISGAAPIARSTLDLFRSLDMPIHEVYGLSENCGPATLNTLERCRIGTVGPPLGGVEVRTAEDGEVLIRGGNVFLGYFKDPRATAEARRDGWLYSGDVGELDADGFLRITDRKKDLIVTAGGKNVAPQPIEQRLRAIPEVSQAVVVGDRRRFLAALLTLQPEAARRWAEAHGVAWSGVEALAREPRFAGYVEERIAEVNRQLASFETIKRFALLPAELSVESGELTPTLKIKRRAVAERHGEAIERLYA